MFDENSRRTGLTGVLSISLAILFVGFAGGFATERYLVGHGVSNSLVGEVPPPQGVDLSPVWKAWNVIDEKFVPAAVASTSPIASTTALENSERIWGMIGGLAASLNDP